MRFISIRILAAFIGITFLLAPAKETAALNMRIIVPSDQQTVSGIVTIQAVLACNRCGKNLSYCAINALFEKYGTAYPSDFLKAVAWQESGWQQFTSEGAPLGSANPNSVDWGLMQINDKTNPLNLSKEEMDKAKNDLEYCLKTAVRLLDAKQRIINKMKKQENWLAKQHLYDLAGHSDQDILLKAYNGFQKSWKYADAVNAHIKNKPWEDAVNIAFLIDHMGIQTQVARLIDVASCPWDTTTFPDKWHSVRAQAKRGRTNCAHEINVLSRNDMEVRQFSGGFFAENQRGGGRVEWYVCLPGQAAQHLKHLSVDNQKRFLKIKIEFDVNNPETVHLMFMDLEQSIYQSGLWTEATAKQYHFSYEVSDYNRIIDAMHNDKFNILFQADSLLVNGPAPLNLKVDNIKTTIYLKK